MLKYEVEGVGVGGRLTSPTTTTTLSRKLVIYAKCFLFDGDYYVKIVGVALGCALGSLLANLLMGFHKERCSDQFQFCDSNWIK